MFFSVSTYFSMQFSVKKIKFFTTFLNFYHKNKMHETINVAKTGILTGLNPNNL